ncbi:MAG: YbdK family carboxylate-amine ligase [Planctomycetota bacterium]|nr:YbdK family carboxylate-amine ligase [Planctomycetaceae bacterium]MDQ3329898.1 YbdK family carboxylate-amine ligase [Planctomycetota bacterium]
MTVFSFTRNERPTLGVEVELQLVDAKSGALTSAIEAVLAELPDGLSEQIKPELMQCYLEINTCVCKTVAEAGKDLKDKLDRLERITDALGLKLFWAGTHPFSSWRDQKITKNDRYLRLVDLMQDVARRLVTFGLHVHVGVDSGDKAVMICDRMLRHLPLLLALSSNSPFWEGRATGLHSNRANIMQGLPTAGLPRRMRNYSEYVWLVNHLIATGFINTIREIWWDIRPHHNFGTVEVRVCDVPGNLEQVLAITALIQCLVVALSREIDEGTYLHEYHPMMVQQNKWRAMRYGPSARLVDGPHMKPRSVQEIVDELVELLTPLSRELGCEAELASARSLPSSAGSARQLALFSQNGNHESVVREILG